VNVAEHKPKRFRLAFVNAAEDVPRIVRAYGRACFGEFALVLRPTDSRGVLVRVTREGAWVWRADDHDAPILPEVAIDPRDAVALVKTEQKAILKPGPITLRGQWAGYLHCDDGVPRVELTRKLAAYGLLRISSSATGWTWTVERTEKWFSTPGSDTGTAPTLLRAIEAGLARAMGLLGEACSTRDSHRRAALDEGWATAHPIRPAKEGRDPTERLRPKEPRRTKAAEPPRMDAPVALPDAPATPAGVQRMADELAREADALAALRDVTWVWHDSTAIDDAVAWFREAGLGDIADDLASYQGSPDHPPERLLERLRAALDAAALDPEAQKDGAAVLGKLEEAFRAAPYVLERARRLIRHAARLAESRLCQGRERKEAADAISRAIHAYDEARTAVVSGATAEARTKVRSMGEWAALAAAKAARSCAAGQASLPTKPARPRPVKAPVVEQPAPVADDPPSKPRRGRRRATPAVETAPPPDPPATEAPKTTPPRRRGGKKVAVPEADAEKDKLLLDAFREAVTAAMSETGPD
jgi:hypothetical protein